VSTRVSPWLRGASLALGVLLATPAAAQQPAPDRPNVVLIITDDVGYGDLGAYGGRDVRTPSIDRLAREGVRLTDFYAAPQCTPTRAALITGRYEQRVALERALSTAPAGLQLGLPATGRSLPKLLRDNGYATGLVGKWHLGFKPEFGPNAHGFDYFYGFLAGYIDFYQHTRGIDGAADLQENLTPVADTGYVTDLITARAVRFVERHRAGPFFLEVAYSAAHWPFQPPGRPTRARNNGAFQAADDSVPATRADYIAMLERADEGVGEILQALTRFGLARNTLVIFTNDNGGEWLSDNGPLFHRKDTLWEGGIRVPAIFRWPARLPAGRTSRQVGRVMDLTASILAATGTRPPADPPPDGMDLLPILAGQAREVDRALFWRIDTPIRQQRAVRDGRWKLLIDADDLLLFDLERDIGERRDLARAHPDIVRRLRASHAAWEREVAARP
jgi:arylsulfatase A-like enzyme